MNSKYILKKILSIIIALFLGNFAVIILGSLFREQICSLIPNYYYRTLAVQLVSAALTLICIFIFHKIHVFRISAKVLKEGFCASMPLIVIYTLLMAGGLTDLPGKDIIPLPEIICIVFNWILIGVAEEGLFRGVIYELIADIYGRSTRKAVLLTLLTSGAVFGLAHITNIFAPGISYAAVAIQVVSAIASGILFGAVKFRSYGSIWPAVFVHALVDAASFVYNGMLWGGTEVGSVNSLDPRSLLMIPILIGLAVFIMRKSKTDELIRS